MRTTMESSIDIWRATLARHQAVMAKLEGIGPDLQAMAAICEEALRAGHKLIFFGNGGSAADAQHLVAEFVVRFQRDRRALPALALTVNTSILTAHSNDYAYETIFSRQIEALCQKGDVVFGLSTSGKSSSVVRGIESARKLGGKTIGMTGQGDSPLSAAAGFTLKVPSDETARVQEAHMLIGHWLCDVLEAAFFDTEQKR